ncbi:hypothetical protein J416_10186 [Gracilibacillus halophilus YIM-C55.5]|uniref:Peptidase M16 C-terminal domain-containing protein n=1 Tax=Gracilibacillus halophilus YIM-C55.5 TaxID=1308866 RepID=N4WBB1_9BACI|nr:pitrilysin family protein [Gracilibacillus halophilus]ENH96529.1 hypothetical protein J416_10186 [Gracilibacillus halophilus YIM-C55.5]
MRENVEEVISKQGYDIHLLHTKKFKTIHIAFKFVTNLSRDSITKRALLPYVLQQGTQNYPTAIALRQQLDELYGAVLHMDSSKKGENHIITVRLEMANEQYISSQTSLLDQAIQLLEEILYRPKLEGNGFDPQQVEREKQTLQSKMTALTEDKMSFANTRMIEEMCESEPYQLRVHGYREDLEEINGESLYQYYQKMLQEDRLDVFAIGDIDELDVMDKINQMIQRNTQQQLTQPTTQQQIESSQTIIETDQVQQAKLHFGYRTGITYDDKKYPALHVFNGLFGGFPSSKLFLNVREKHSLAYYAASRVESHKGLLFVFSGIAPDQYDRARSIILEQMEQMRTGDFTEQDIQETKDMLVNQLKETLDNPQGMMELHYQQVLGNSQRSPEQFIQEVQQVTKQEVTDVAKQIQLDTVYLLTSEDGDSNEAS